MIERGGPVAARYCSRCDGAHKLGVACPSDEARSPAPKGAIARQAEAAVRGIPATRPVRRKKQTKDERESPRTRLRIVGSGSLPSASTRKRRKRSRKRFAESFVQDRQATRSDGSGRKSRAVRTQKTCRECRKQKPIDHFPERSARCYFCGGQTPSVSVRTVSGGAPTLGKKR